MATGPATARSDEFGAEVATQTEPPKVDAAIQAELSDLAAPRPATSQRRGESQHETAAAAFAGSRPATTASRRPATTAGAGAVPGQSRPPTQSRGKPATAAAAAAATAPAAVQRRPSQAQPTQPVQFLQSGLQPPTPAGSVAFSVSGGDGGGGQPGVLFVDNNRSWQQYQESSRVQRQDGAECTPMVYSYNPDPRLRAWQSLEHARLHQLGLSSKLSRRYNVQRSRQFVPVGLHMRTLQPAQGSAAAVRAAFLPPLVEECSDNAQKKNDVAPFLTFQKPTCGYFFTRETDNRKVKHGLAPADLPRWGVDLLDRQ